MHIYLIAIDLYVLGTAKAKDLYQWNGTSDVATRSKVANNTETCNCESIRRRPARRKQRAGNQQHD